MFLINEVYEPTLPLPEIKGEIRVIDSIKLERVVLIDVDLEQESTPIWISYERWVDLLHSNSLRLSPDPFLKLTSSPTKLPDGAAARLKNVIEATGRLAKVGDLLSTARTLSREIKTVARCLNLSERTVKRWTMAWLKAGRNPAAAVRAFIEIGPESQRESASQTGGSKRGVKSRKPELAGDAPAHELRDRLTQAFKKYVKIQKMSWRDAYYEALISLWGVPEDDVEDVELGVLLDPVLIEKFRPPTWSQCRYAFRKLAKDEVSKGGTESPRGDRGTALDGVPGPGFFEIDATFFQIQLISEVTQSKLIGRPVVYLIVDIFSTAIVGYTVSLENASWSVAAQALYNCFHEKGPTFERLGLPFKSEDWDCHELPTSLRADRAELVSNMGMKFPTSGIRVEVTPSMTPEAKGTVEGKNSEIKKPRPSRFKLPGRFSKKRKRRETDGKRNAALNLRQFEQILVEIIMDINGEPVNPRKIPPEALREGAPVASRIGLYKWARKHRAGFTRQVSANFPYEYLLTQRTGKVTPLGIKVDNEVFNCDYLRDNGHLAAAVCKPFNIPVALHTNFAGEIYFQDKGLWICAKNNDPAIIRLQASFAEAKEYRALQEATAAQAGLRNHSRRRTRTPVIRKSIREAVEKKNSMGIKTTGSTARIRENRQEERAQLRRAGFNGVLPGAEIEGTGTPSTSAADKGTSIRSPEANGRAAKMLDLWAKVPGGTKT